ncbi:MAG: hypothetical protein ABSC55_12575 [Syntrophorhabdales bacterium]|jgi:hypothetical protein
MLTEIREAREELEKLEHKIASSNKPVEIKLELSLRHAYHHLNFAWNIRHIETGKYSNLTEADFKKWGKFPEGFNEHL